jgi:ribonuclease HI
MGRIGLGSPARQNWLYKIGDFRDNRLSEMRKVTIVCDGSSLGNGTNGASAGAVAILSYVEKDGKTHNRAVGEYLGHATNNQAEIIAAAIGLEMLRYPCEVEVITDSRYVVETQSGRYREKKNHEYWQRLREAAGRHKVKWTWTRGHDGHPVQERCDKAAKKIAASGEVDAQMLEAVVKTLPAA